MQGNILNTGKRIFWAQLLNGDILPLSLCQYYYFYQAWQRGAFVTVIGQRRWVLADGNMLLQEDIMTPDQAYEANELNEIYTNDKRE